MYACKGRDIKHLDKGNGVIIRHDIDNDFMKSYRLSLMQNKIGVKATYFVLDLKSYFKDEGIFPLLREMQDAGHEIGWHNAALSLWFFKGKDLYNAINEPLEKMRSEGLNIIGTVAHGNSDAKAKYGFTHSHCWDILETPVGNPQYALSDFGLLYDSMLTVYKDVYIADNNGKLQIKYNMIPNIIPETIIDTLSLCHDKRVLISFHPEHWDI